MLYSSCVTVLDDPASLGEVRVHCRSASSALRCLQLEMRGLSLRFSVVVGVDRFHIALFSAFEQTRCALVAWYSN